MGWAEKLKPHRQKLQLAGVITAGVAVLGIAAFVGTKFKGNGIQLGHVPGASAPHGGEHGEKEGHGKEHSDAGHSAAPEPSLFAEWKESLGHFQDKIIALHHAEEDNERLRLENTYLRAKVEGMHFDCRTDSARGLTKEMAEKLGKETGSKLGRTLAGIAYRPPGHLLPAQLYTLGVSYFKAREDEKAAVILSFLTGLADEDTYKTPKNHLMTGVAWYRIDNLEMADSYFDKVLAVSEKPVETKVAGHGEGQGDAHAVADSHGDAHGERAPASVQTDEKLMQFKAQARLWKGLVARRMGQNKKSQSWLREVVDHHPSSEEASWVNTGVVNHGSDVED